MYTTLSTELSSPRVELAGYAVPHPSEAKIIMRVQIRAGAMGVDGQSYTAAQALEDALVELRSRTDELRAAFADACALVGTDTDTRGIDPSMQVYR